MATPNTYSFLNFQGAIQDEGGSVLDVGNGAGIAADGVSFSFNDEKSSMSIGADGRPMHSLHATKGGRFVLRVQKTSPLNAFLNALYRFTTVSSANFGQTRISGRDPVRGDTISCEQCGITKHPDVVYAVEGPALEWVWNVGVIDFILGDGTPG